MTIYPPGASYLASYGASAINLGSWIGGDTQPDYGSKDLITSLHSSNALTDGGLFSARFAPPRKMAIPMILNQPGTTTPQAAVRFWEGALARAAHPGAMVSIQPEGVPTAEAVFFDVIDGRWEPAYNIYENRAGVRRGTLYLDTQPWGYWPTEILLASAASIGFIGKLAVNGANIIGDVPPLAHVVVAPTVASVYAGNYVTDMLAYSFGGLPSFAPYVNPSSLTSPGLAAPFFATFVGDKFAPASVAVMFSVVATGGQVLPAVWQQMADTGTFIPSALEPAYRGRFRVFAFAKATPTSLPWQMIVDADRMNTALYPSMASSNQIATAVSVIPGGARGGGDVIASPAYGLYDCGELSLPPQGSGFQQGDRLRIWLQSPTAAINASYQFYFGGVFLLPVDGAFGILTRGLGVPTLSNATIGVADFNNGFVENIYLMGANPSGIVSDGRAQFRGVLPRIGASTQQLTILTGDRIGGNTAGTYLLANGNVEYSRVSVSYRPQFQFLRGLP